MAGKTVKRRIGELRPAPYNPRKITEAKLQLLGRAMREFGDLSGIVFNRKTGNLVGGHQRVKHLDPSWEVIKTELDKPDAVGTVAVGHIETPFGRWSYREVDWGENTEKAANVAANQHGGEFDIPKLKELLTELDTGEFPIALTGFEEAELENLITQSAETEKGGEVKFAQELGEENNYIVLVFKTTTDWLQALTLLDLESRYSKKVNGEAWKKGMGRVVVGPDAIAKLRT